MNRPTGARPPDARALAARVDRLDRSIARLQRDLLETLTRLADADAWADDGAHDMAHWTTMRLGVSRWKAERWLASGRALRVLPAIGDAFRRGELGIDKVVELTRFAAFDDEDALVRWARGVSSGAIRRVGDLRAREGLGRDAADADRDRWLEYRYTDGGRRFRLDAELPGAAGSAVARALDRLGDEVPAMPDEDDERLVGARRADALVALCSARIADDADQDRATVVVHADLEALLDLDANAQIEEGPVIAGSTLHRLLCNARLQGVVEHPDGTVRSVGRLTREPAPWMMRQLRHRDGTCRFPGCDARRFTQAHHVEWWSRGGATDLDNLILVCSFHHRLVHEHGWGLTIDGDGEATWIRPDDQRRAIGASSSSARAGPGERTSAA
jgi:Domain of unknown function (DUF222)/HNH endonuclease